MPYETGTATDYANMLDKLITFATVTVPAADRWVLIENTGEKTVLKGIGSGADAIFVAIQKYANLSTDAFGWYLNGYTGYVNGLNFIQQPGALINYYPALPLIDTTLTYWLMVNSRRIMLVCKCGTTYQAMYLGYPLPFATPNQFPYPLIVGGSSCVIAQPRYSGSSNYQTHFTNPYLPPGGEQASVLNLRLPSGLWLPVRHGNGQTTLHSYYVSGGVWPFSDWYYGIWPSVGRLRPTQGGKYTLQPLIIQRAASGPDTVDRFGEFDGIKHVSGFSASAEDVGNDGVNNWLFVPNVFRVDVATFTAFRLS